MYRLINKKYRRSSFIATCAIFCVIPVLVFSLCDFQDSLDALVMVTMPFSLPGLLTGLIYVSVVMGLIFTWIAVFGLVMTLQNRFGDEPL